MLTLVVCENAAAAPLLLRSLYKLEIYFILLELPQLKKIETGLEDNKV